MPNMHLRCGDIVDGCPFTTHASDERELLAKVKQAIRTR